MKGKRDREEEEEIGSRKEKKNERREVDRVKLPRKAFLCWSINIEHNALVFQ